MPREQREVLFGGHVQTALVADHQRQAARTQYFAGAAQYLVEADTRHLGQCRIPQRPVGIDQVIEEAQQILLAAPRPHLVQALATKDHAADAVVVLQHRPADQRGQASGQHRLELLAGAEEGARTLLQQQIDRPLAFFVEQLGVGLAGAGGDAPVDGPYVVTGLIGPYLVEVHAATAQARMVQADQRAAPSGGGKQLHLDHPVAHLDELGQAQGHAVALGHLRPRPPDRGCAAPPGHGRYRRPPPRRTG